jgi:hypothetical protein
LINIYLFVLRPAQEYFTWNRQVTKNGSNRPVNLERARGGSKGFKTSYIV